MGPVVEHQEEEEEALVRVADLRPVSRPSGGDKRCAVAPAPDADWAALLWLAPPGPAPPAIAAARHSRASVVQFTLSMLPIPEELACKPFKAKKNSFAIASSTNTALAREIEDARGQHR